MNITVKSRYEALDEARLAKFEAEMNCTLPKAYREFLLTNNGGIPSPSCFEYYDPIEEAKQVRSIDEFFFIGGKSEAYSIYFHIYTRIIPDDALPIAYDGQQGTIYISFKPGEEGKIYLHANWIEPEEVNVFLLSNSFEEFLDSLYTC